MALSDKKYADTKRCIKPLLSLAASLGLLLNACATAPPSKPQDKGAIYYPAPPEQPRFVHETTLRRNTDIHIEQSEERLQRLLLGAVLPVHVFDKPFDIAARNGRIYITDSLGKRIHGFDVPRRRYFVFGIRFEGTVGKPAGIALDHQGRVYAVDIGRGDVVVYDGLGLYQRRIGGSETLHRPTDVAVTPNGDRIYVVDTGGVDSDAHRLVVFDAGGQLLFTIGRRGGDPGEFNLPVDAAVAADGTVYVLDAGNFRVQAFDRDGYYLRQWGQVGRSFGQFARPRHIAVDDQGNVYVSDANFGNIQIFNSQGQLLLAVGRIGKTDGRGRFALVSGIAVDETGRIYAVDQIFKKVEVFRRLTGLEDS